VAPVASWRVDPDRVASRWFAYRQVSPAWPPLFHAAGEPHPSQEGGRWHRRGEGYCQYLSLSPTGAWAECVRYLSIRSEAYAREQRRNLWLMLVDESDVADLSTFDHYDACGLDPAIAVGAHPRAQSLAAELRTAGYRGLLSPSAALPGAVNLTLFGVRYEHLMAGDLVAWTNPDPTCWLAVQAAAERTGPPVQLCVEACFRGAPHLGYREWVKAKGLPLPAGSP
jgi:hypothetical protein